MTGRIPTSGLVQILRWSLIIAALFSADAIAAAYTLPDDLGQNGSPFKDCDDFQTPAGSGIYICDRKVEIGANDTVTLSADVTLNMNGNEFKVKKNGGVVNQGIYTFNVSNASRINIEGPGPVVMGTLSASGKVEAKNGVVLTANLISTGDEVKVKGGSTVTGDLTALTDKVKIEDGGNTVNGNIVADDNVEIKKGGGNTITGDITSQTGDIILEDGNHTITGNLDATTGDVDISGGNNTIDGDITANGGAGTLTIAELTTVITGVCNPDHPPQCGGGGGGGTCTTMQIALDGEEFRGIDGLSDSDIFAAGHDGSIYRFNGTMWNKTDDTGGRLHGIHMVTTDLAHTVGHDGEVYQFTGGTDWNLLVPGPPTNEDLNDVWAASANEVWVVGKGETLYRWDGASTWDDQSGDANVDNNKDLVAAWGDEDKFYTAEKDGPLYRYDRNADTWQKILICDASFNMEVTDIWGDTSDRLYISGKHKGVNDATVWEYDENTNSCSIVFSTGIEDKFESISGNGNNIYAVGKDGIVADNRSGTWSVTQDGNDDYKAVWVSPTNTAYYAGKDGMITVCEPAAGEIHHFVISPALISASTCQPNAITITAEDINNDTVTDYEGTIRLSTSTGNGDWSKNTANGVLDPDPDTDDNGRARYTFDLLDAGVAILDLTNTHAESQVVRALNFSEGILGFSPTITFGDNVFVISLDSIQIAGRPMLTKIEMWRKDPVSGNCFIDTNYNYNHTLKVSLDRGGKLPGASAPTIYSVAIPNAEPALPNVTFDFSATPGEVTFDIETTDVGQYRLVVTDDTFNHSDLPITGTSEIMTVRPFGLGIDTIEADITTPPSTVTNPGESSASGTIFTGAGHDFRATVTGVLWDAADDIDDDGILDSGRSFFDNAPTVNYAWDTNFENLLTGFTPSAGAVGNLINGAILETGFAGGEATVLDLRYSEVGSFTLTATADDYLNGGVSVPGDEIVVGRFVPDSFEVSVDNDGEFENACPGITQEFTYIGQPFGYKTTPSITVTAINKQGGTTQQYRGAFAKLDGSSVTVVATQDDTTQGTDMLPLVVSYTPATMGFTVIDDGTVEYVFGADNYRYGPAAPTGGSVKLPESEVGQFDSDINPAVVEVSDGEVTTVISSAVALDPIGNTNRSGRLRMTNALGSELSPLTMDVFVEYFDGGFYRKSLDDDNCTVINTSDLENTPPGFSVPAVPVSGTTSAGDINYTYPAPGSPGDVLTRTRLDTGYADHLWLRYDWDGNGLFDNDPTATATFGVYQGNEYQIFQQQTFQ